jgi:hypothetical protein
MDTAIDLFDDDEFHPSLRQSLARAEKVGQRIDGHRALDAHRRRRDKAMRLKNSNVNVRGRNIK